MSKQHSTNRLKFLAHRTSIKLVTAENTQQWLSDLSAIADVVESLPEPQPLSE